MVLRGGLVCFFLVLWLLPLSAQEFVAGLSLGVGRSWEVERFPPNQFPDPNDAIIGGSGFELGTVIGYRLDNFLISGRPTLMLQNTAAQLRPSDGMPLGSRESIYPVAALLPLRVDYTFGEQRFRPSLGLGGGFLINVAREELRSGLVPEPVLPYLEVSVGVEYAWSGFRIRPEIHVRNSTGPIFSGGESAINERLQYHRWGYVAIGIVVTN
ncbi:hypothetical protein [Lewinella sp. W8]|uniref:hypothetical protein n=1 Tax=Lewinella sp. W8 TaxID=2528208 RepID=UPI001068A157|nr:hypothetical protein [Lewinella sp. W8]MTB49531.1 hypothetical protein [Lewinella sp. W8]